MKLLCLQENFNHALIIGEKIISKSINLPILSNILLETDQGRLKISSTNLEIGITSWIGAKIEKEGALAVPVKPLSSFIASLPNKKINLEINKSVLNIKCGSMEANIKGLSAEDFPLIPQIKEPYFIKIKSQILKNALSQVIPAAAISETRPEITGVFFNFNKTKSDRLILAATDSYRLAEKTVKLKNTSDIKEEKQDKKASEKTIIIPRVTVQELIRILPEEGEVAISLSENQILFNFEATNLVSRLIEGTYPDYKQIIPTTFKTKTIINTNELINSIKIASFFTNTRINSIQLKMRPKDTLEISSETGDIGSNLSRLAAEIEGKEERITFNWRYVLDGLNNITTEKVILETNGPNSPSLLRPADGEDYIYIIMPIKS